LKASEGLEERGGDLKWAEEKWVKSLARVPKQSCFGRNLFSVELYLNFEDTSLSSPEIRNKRY